MDTTLDRIESLLREMVLEADAKARTLLAVDVYMAVSQITQEAYHGQAKGATAGGPLQLSGKR